MSDDTWLTPDQARARFGELTVRVGSQMRVHSTFERPEGEWRPAFDQTKTGLLLRGYRLHPELRMPGPVRPPFRPKG